MRGNTSQGIVYSLKIAKAALDDLAKIGCVDPDTESDILALLQHIKDSQDLLSVLTTKDYCSDPLSGFSWDIDWIYTQQRKGRDLWRLKDLDLESMGIQYRIVYGFDKRINRYYVLAVLHRDIAYDASNPRFKELLATYDRLNIPGEHF